MAKKDVDPEFPCSLTIRTPFPTHRLASSALRALQVDTELSPMVRRSFSLLASNPPSPTSTSSSQQPSSTSSSQPNGTTNSSSSSASPGGSANDKTILVTEYKAKTNRMLRVAVNGFMESLGVVLGVMERLDVDCLPGSGAPPPPAAKGAGEAVAAKN